ncbi:hypothetical protein [Colwellia sp. Bg11-28]|uniref:hypothetical protein n=1 Tax=Colwellia sp. Bg11-28 TaxID=2058305 RepID=UPI000C32AC0D|nr:hypothetical protein [Colwellia sp. Bg11-28]PKH89222.1 hypothetical protein CXF79_00035 [Colwellia sp. Bg11-28]
MNVSKGENEVESIVDYKWRQDRCLVIVFWFNKSMNFENLTYVQPIVEAKNFKGSIAAIKMFLTTGSYCVSDNENGVFLPSENMELNIINDRTLQLNLTLLSSDVTHINIQFKKHTVYTLASPLGEQLDEGEEFNYELFL